MEIEKQTRNLIAGCSKHCFEVVDEGSKHCFEVVDKSKHCFEVADSADVV
ncbi:chlorohydrolase [Streptococcus pneumoniae]|nr:chlorohydrolase [Streptococcus pneumoniae]SNH15287.1 chlorohydrolase [Streptococcus pneumoniae]